MVRINSLPKWLRAENTESLGSPPGSTTWWLCPFRPQNPQGIEGGRGGGAAGLGLVE